MIMFPQIAPGAVISSDEELTAHRWVAAAFESIRQTNPPDPGLEVLENRDRVQKNGRYGKPLQIAGVKYDRGLFCHAPSKIRVRLPGPATSFSAVIGADDGLQIDNHDWPSGPLWPAIIFTVQAGEKQLFRSDIIRNGMPGVPVKVDLGGADDFILEVGKGERIAWGEADWAEAKVTLADGHTLWLDELTLPGDAVQADTANPPFSFICGGAASAQLLKEWVAERSSRKLDAHRLERTVRYSDPKTGLQIRCVAVEYQNFPTIEWTVFFKNAGRTDSPIIENVQALDVRMVRGPTSEFLLHHSLGSSCLRVDYKPSETLLLPRVAKRFAPVTGYSSDPVMPYFNVDLQAGEGVIVAVGWPGQWSTEFARDEGRGLRIRAGQEITHFKLHPDEEVRTPLIVLQFYKGDWIRAQNLWRRWMIAYGLPHPGGKTVSPMLPGCNTDLLGYTNTDEANQKQFIDLYCEKGLPIDWWWIDYGWHPKAGEKSRTGMWEVSEARFPKGLRPVTDHARAKGMKTILWFAPEHSPFGAKAEWLLKGKGIEPLCDGGEVSVLNLGNPAALKWMTDMVDKIITDEGIDCYRHDTAMGPLVCWQANDADDRQGITENKYVCGFLAFYDELLRRHDHLLIDNCCRGGRRLDLECMRRSVPLWRSDIFYEPISHQGQTYGLNLWLPFHGTGTVHDNAYAFRSNMGSSVVLLYDLRKTNLNFDLLRRLCDQWWDIAPNFLGDYYPLTPYSLDTEAWMAWQYDRPEVSEGFVQVFRREQCPGESIYLKLRGLQPDALYSVSDLDAGKAQEIQGRELISTGLAARIPERPGAAVIRYRKVK